MGSSHSTQGGFGSHKGLLEKLVGQQDIEYSNAFWPQLFNLQRPLAADEPSALLEAMIPHCQQLLIHNPVTHNFQASGLQAQGAKAHNAPTPDCRMRLYRRS